MRSMVDNNRITLNRALFGCTQYQWHKPLIPAAIASQKLAEWLYLSKSKLLITLAIIISTVCFVVTLTLPIFVAFLETYSVRFQLISYLFVPQLISHTLTTLILSEIRMQFRILWFLLWQKLLHHPFLVSI